MNKSYSMGYNNAYKYVDEHADNPDPRIITILEGLIRESDGGLDFLINRNPTLGLGSIIAVKCVGIEPSYTMSVANVDLVSLEGDYDGDTLNILYIVNKEFAKYASLAFSPRNSLYISKNDGFFNNAYNQLRDTLINLNTFVQLGRRNYSKQQLDLIKIAQESI